MGGHGVSEVLRGVPRMVASVGLPVLSSFSPTLGPPGLLVRLVPFPVLQSLAQDSPCSLLVMPRPLVGGAGKVVLPFLVLNSTEPLSLDANQPV